MKIITLTLNPAFDTHCALPTLALHHENFAAVTSTDAGGKGVNISRALTANGVCNQAVVLTGAENQSSFLQKLAEEGLEVSSISVAGRIRENLTVHEGDGKETRISFEGFTCSESVLEQVEAAAGAVDQKTIVTLTGSNPPGLSAEAVAPTAPILSPARTVSPAET